MGYHEIDYVLLTHAHIDHAGMLPWIHARGFRGQVITTYATADLCSIMLKDSAHIQEMEAEWKNRKARRAGRGEVEALYTMQDAEDVLNTQLKLTARAPFSGSQFDLIMGFWIKETEGVLIEKETAAKRRASGVYTRLVDAGKMLLDVIHRNEGGANKDLTRFTEQILALCDKWDR